MAAMAATAPMDYRADRADRVRLALQDRLAQLDRRDATASTVTPDLPERMARMDETESTAKTAIKGRWAKWVRKANEVRKAILARMRRFVNRITGTSQ